MCEMYSCPVKYDLNEMAEDTLWDSQETIEEDKIILETEITLTTGPNITMKIHEESRPNSVVENFDLKSDQAILKVLDDDSENDFYKGSPRTPRKVRFGGESVKLRTPESESSNQADGDNEESAIKITVVDAISIRTKKSLIPIRLSSLPSSPKKNLSPIKTLCKKFQSAPNLSSGRSSKIPLRKPENLQGRNNLKSNKGNHQGKAPHPKIKIHPPILKHNRSDGVLSPLPVHNEIELFHNLTRSPEINKKKVEDTNKSDIVVVGNEEKLNEMQDVPEFKSYNSFKVCDDSLVPKNDQDSTGDGKVKLDSKSSSLQKSLSSLTSDDEVWAKSEALESLVKMLKEHGTCQSLEPGPAALLFEALFACHHRDRLHNLADDALMILIEGVRQEVLEQCLPRLALSLCKMGASSGVRCALVVMKKLPPRKLQMEILQKGFGHRTREGALQILMSCARLYPRPDVEVAKISEFAAISLRDRRRKIRQAALETLAAAAQTSSIHEVLNIVENTIKQFEDFNEVMQIVRLRLSRKQLPTVNLDGSLRYSTPIDQNELEWIAGGTVFKTPSSPLSSTSSSSTSINYWMRNSRHGEKFKQLSQCCEVSKRKSINFLSPSFHNCQKPGILRPIYILQPETPSPEAINQGHRKYDRGRSFSPPKHLRGQFPNVDPVSLRAPSSNPVPSTSASVPQPPSFRKSFSSDQLYFADRFPNKNDPYSCSFSSRSSSTSTGSSTRSGFWHKSGIPVPVQEDRFKIRHNTSSNFSSNGPLIARSLFFRSSQHQSKENSPNHQTDTAQDNGSISHLSLPPPQSSGSESSGYFTPSPPDVQPPAFIKMDTEERLSSDNERPLSINSNLRNGAHSACKSVNGDCPKESHEEQLNNYCLGEVINDNYPSVESIHLNNNGFETSSSNQPQEPRKSKSVVDLTNFLPKICSAGTRKPSSSAPARNEDNLSNSNIDQTDSNGTIMSYEQQEKFVTNSSVTITKTKLERRISRNSSIRSIRVSPRTAPDSSNRPPSKPKDLLQHVLMQLESPNWETTVDGLQNLAKLARQNPETIDQQIHQVCVVLAKHIKNLRSQVARTACNTATELFLSCKRSLEMELEEIACPLFQRTADTNRFLRADANATLDIMCEHLPAHRVIPVVTARGCAHQNAIIRAASMRMLGDIVRRLGADRVFSLPKELRDRLLYAGANSLADGNVDARSHGKAMFKYLMAYPHFQRYLHEAVPQNILRHISKVLASIKSET
ncbi:hypothetical protein ABEB36_004480 [Hypothenemus hampei]|uniref:TOG domain-containing protein n=1 Tax=Hypothenemus hampei TaxID=57062 RepID=A0ABD1F3F9_HYPHA